MTVYSRSSVAHRGSPRSRPASGHLLLLALVWLLLPLTMAACDLQDVQSLLMTPTPVLSGPTVGPQATATPTPLATPAGETPSVVTLTLWTTEDLAPGGENTGGAVLVEQIAAFQTANPNIELKFELKKAYGRAGILDSLLATKAAAPANLPDLVVIDSTELMAAARAGILRPLDEDLAEELRDLFPFAQDAGRVDGKLMGIPFEVDIEHLAFDRAKVSQPPLTWQDVMTSGFSYVFPAGGQQGLINDAFLIQYLALGGQLVDETGEPALDEGKLVQVLQFYRDSTQVGVVQPEVTSYRNLEDCWAVYRAGRAVLTHVSSWRFLRDRADLEDVGASAIPTADGSEVTLARGWSYAIVAKDPARQEAALQVLRWFIAPENLQDWSRASDHLPTLRSAMAEGESDYRTFLSRQLEVAQAAPPASILVRIGEPLQRAVEDVLAGDLTPEEAAAQVLAVLQ